MTPQEEIAQLKAHHSAQLQQLGGRVKTLEGALHQAAMSLADCAAQFKGHNMLASYDVAKVYEADARDILSQLGLVAPRDGKKKS